MRSLPQTSSQRECGKEVGSTALDADQAPLCFHKHSISQYFYSPIPGREQTASPKTLLGREPGAKSPSPLVWNGD